jgi:hypothetical protein
MKRLKEKLEKTFAAITFAEAGESKIAVEVLKEAEENVERVKKIDQRILNNMALTSRLSQG